MLKQKQRKPGQPGTKEFTEPVGSQRQVRHNTLSKMKLEERIAEKHLLVDKSTMSEKHLVIDKRIY